MQSNFNLNMNGVDMRQVFQKLYGGGGASEQPSRISNLVVSLVNHVDLDY